MRPDQGPNPQPRHAPWLGTGPSTFQFTGLYPTNSARKAGAKFVIILEKENFLWLPQMEKKPKLYHLPLKIKHCFENNVCCPTNLFKRNLSEYNTVFRVLLKIPIPKKKKQNKKQTKNKNRKEGWKTIRKAPVFSLWEPVSIKALWELSLDHSPHVGQSPQKTSLLLWRPCFKS